MTQREQLKLLIDRGKVFVRRDSLDFMYNRKRPRPSGPPYEEWLQDINTYNERWLKTHPAYQKIKNVLFFRQDDAADQIMGALNSVYNDEAFWRNGEQAMSRIMPTEAQDKPLYDVFISHANRDQASFVDELKASLDKLGIPVFYDKDSLEWGDNWKTGILNGVAKAEFAIIVISENFFDREWTEKELKEFLARQNKEGQKIILPILHNISVEQLREKYPSVADVQAISSSEYTCDEIALKFAAQLIKRLKA